jgi:hypothetical protein
MKTVYASFHDHDLAEKATGALIDHGVASEAISLIASERETSNARDVAVDDDYHTVAVSRSGATYGEKELGAKSGISTTTSGDAASGAAKGAGLGLGVGVLAGLASLAIPGFGLVLGGGALATALAGAAGATAAGAVAGGVTGYLKDQGVPEHAAEPYHEAFERGGAVLAVHTPSNDIDATTVENILDKYGATNINAY